MERSYYDWMLGREVKVTFKDETYVCGVLSEDKNGLYLDRKKLDKDTIKEIFIVKN